MSVSDPRPRVRLERATTLIEAVRGRALGLASVAAVESIIRPVADKILSGDA